MTGWSGSPANERSTARWPRKMTLPLSSAFTLSTAIRPSRPNVPLRIGGTGVPSAAKKISSPLNGTRMATMWPGNCCWISGNEIVGVCEDANASQSRQVMRSTLLQGDHVDLDEYVFRQSRGLDRSPRRRRRRHEAAVDLVHCREVPHVFEKHSRAHYFLHGRSGGVEDGRNVFQRAVRLLLDPTGNHLTARGIEGRLAGDE